MATATRDDRDGRILPATHWASLVVFAILVPALVILWGMPDRTADAWSWTIMPDLTPIFLGAGYGAGAYFFLRTFLSKQFHPSAAGIFGAGFFATLMLIATLLHDLPLRRRPRRRRHCPAAALPQHDAPGRSSPWRGMSSSPASSAPKRAGRR